MKQKLTVIFLSSSGFPFKISAFNEKYKLLAKGLIEADYEVKLLTKLNNIKNLEKNYGVFEGIDYIFLSGIKERKKLLSKIIGILKAFLAEFLFIANHRHQNAYNYLILSYCAFPLVLYYSFISKIFRYKLVISIMEFHPVTQKGFFAKINAKLFDYYSFYFAHGAIPISNFLYNFIKERYPKYPILVVPVLSDYNFKSINVKNLNISGQYFLYCGSIGFKDVIDFVVNTFSKIQHNTVRLKLVLSGKINDLQVFQCEIKNKNIDIYHTITYDELYSLYQNALGLLIPLRPNLQDKARFPQKIAEYLASGRPIITTNYGEIPFYFKNNENAFVAEKYDIEMYLEKLLFVLDNPVVATQVGLNGKKLGRDKFHYANYGSILSNFLNSLSN